MMSAGMTGTMIPKPIEFISTIENTIAKAPRGVLRVSVIRRFQRGPSREKPRGEYACGQPEQVPFP